VKFFVKGGERAQDKALSQALELEVVKATAKPLARL
jgi:hypothetical protein